MIDANVTAIDRCPRYLAPTRPPALKSCKRPVPAEYEQDSARWRITFTSAAYVCANIYV
jgi:hypothetical protein